MNLKKFALISVLFLSACTVQEELEVEKGESSYEFDESLNGRGAWNWKGYSTSSSESPVWRQIDHPFGFIYPDRAPLSDGEETILTESMDEVKIEFGDVQTFFSLPLPQEELGVEVDGAEGYCRSFANGSDQTILSSSDIILDDFEAYEMYLGSFSSDSTYLDTGGAGYFVCVDLGNAFMKIYAPSGVVLEEFHNVLATLDFE